MKKQRDSYGSVLFFSCWFNKMIRIMKLTVFLIFIFTFQVFASDNYSQTTKLDMKLGETTVKNVLQNIEQQSEFYFLFNQKLVDVNRKVHVNVKKEKIHDILAQVFDGTEIDYVVIDRQIVLSPGKFLAEIKRLQPIEVTGRVTSAETGEPLPGVNIVIQGTSKGATTDMNGNYSIEAPPDATLVFTFVGYQEQTVVVNGRQEIDIAMQPSLTELEEVVAIGYATQTKRDLTGSITSVNADKLEDMTGTQASEILKGNVSGLTVLESHTPGGDATIRIRGLGTINDNNPLWVVDGVPGGTVNPNNIESISVLKDASAQAIYGARAANGVILVTTKSGGKNQELEVNIRVRNGVSRNINSFDLLNTQEYGELMWLMAKNSGYEDYSHSLYGDGSEPDIPEYIIPARGVNVDHSLYDDKMSHVDGDGTYLITKANKKGTDWQDEIDRPAGFQEYAVDVSGGTDNTTYSFMGNYLKEEGVLKYTGYQRYNLRSNITFTPTDWLEIGEKIGVTFSEDWGNQGTNNEGVAIAQSYQILPIIPVKDIMGNFSGSIVPAAGNSRNPVWLLASNQHDRFEQLNNSGNTYVKLNFIENLSLRSLFGFNYTSNNNRSLGYNELAFSQRGKYDGLYESSNFGLQWNWTNTIEYSKVFAELHDVTIIAGTEAVNSTSRWRNASREQFFFKDPEYMQLDVGSLNQQNSGNMTDWKLFSIFSRFNYEFAGKYLIAITLRRDGSSRFGQENRYGTFPAFSAGWNVSEESFMDFSNEYLNFLKIRGGWGQTGNDRIGNYNGYTTFSSISAPNLWGANAGNINNSYYPITGANTTSTPGFQSSAYGNPNVKWETTQTTNIGLDATLFDHINIIVDLWERVTEDMLYPKKIPMVSGYASLPSINVGTMENRGLDIELGYNGEALNGDLQYNVALNLSSYQNELIKLTGEAGEFIQGGGGRQMFYTRAETGTEFPEFYGYIVEGIFQSDEEAASHPPAFGEDGTYNEAGHFKYKDVNGDDIINSEDRTFIGSPHPDFTSGLNFAVKYKDLSLSARFYSSYGNDMVNYTRRFQEFNIFTGNRNKRLLYESWGSPYLDNNKDAKVTKAEFEDAGSQEASTYFIEDASYLRLTNLRISYNLSNLIPQIEFRNLSIFGQATNLFTWTDYDGLDPEVNATGMNRGIDRGAWPTPRQFLFGINVNF